MREGSWESCEAERLLRAGLKFCVANGLGLALRKWKSGRILRSQARSAAAIRRRVKRNARRMNRHVSSSQSLRRPAPRSSLQAGSDVLLKVRLRNPVRTPRPRPPRARRRHRSLVVERPLVRRRDRLDGVDAVSDGGGNGDGEGRHLLHHLVPLGLEETDLGLELLVLASHRANFVAELSDDRVAGRNLLLECGDVLCVQAFSSALFHDKRQWRRYEPFLRCLKFLALILFLIWRFSFELSCLYVSGSGLSVHSGTGGSVLLVDVWCSVAVAKPTTDVLATLAFLFFPTMADDASESSESPISSSSSCFATDAGAGAGVMKAGTSISCLTRSSTSGSSTTAASSGSTEAPGAAPKKDGSMDQLSPMSESPGRSRSKLRGLLMLPELSETGLKPSIGEPGRAGRKAEGEKVEEKEFSGASAAKGWSEAGRGRGGRVKDEGSLATSGAR